MLFQQHLTTLSKTAHINDDPIIHSLLPDSLITIHSCTYTTISPTQPSPPNILTICHTTLPQYHNNPNLNVQYIYLPTNSDNANSNISTTTHIQELRSQADWAAWYQSIKNVLTARGLLNHIYKPPAPNIPWTVLNVLSYPLFSNRATHRHRSKNGKIGVVRTWSHSVLSHQDSLERF